MYRELLLFLLLTNIPAVTLFMAVYLNEQAPPHRGVAVRSIVTVFIGAGLGVLLWMMLF